MRQLQNYSKMQQPKGKNVKTYLTHFPIKSYIEADILSKEVTWRIMDDIRQAGAKGITADEITKKEILPASVVYVTLKELYRLEFIFLYPRSRQIKSERKKRFVCERGTWGKYTIDKEFDAALKVNELLESITYDLKEPIMKVLKTRTTSLAQNASCRGFCLQETRIYVLTVKGVTKRWSSSMRLS